ncbi:MAG: sulfatase family protein [Verrucomicrobiota bacterium]
MAKPNIIIMYADDLGFGDVACYGGTAIPTPNIDRLAAEGMQFDRGYATAATCTPSRYSLLTGAYPWRKPEASILPGNAPSLISPDMTTLPSMLKSSGYTTGVVGKWHLGIGDGNVDWNRRIKGAPLDIGFDYSFIFPATNDRVPCVYIDQDKVAGLDPDDPIAISYGKENPFPSTPSGRKNPDMLNMHYSHGHDGTIVNGISRIGYMRGGNSALWKDDEMAERFLDKAVSFVSDNKDKPFFLYYAFHQPHVPRVPSKRVRGSTGLGPRGDVIAEMDWCVGRMLEALDKQGLRENTIVIFSSDNGPVLDDGYKDKAVELCGDHKPAGPLRGGKYSKFDGGTRVPFIMRWPERIKPGRSSNMVCHVDFLASFASLTNVDLPEDAAPDSLDLMDAMIDPGTPGRHELIAEGMNHQTILHRDTLAFIPPHNGPAINKNTNIELGNSGKPQLYDLSEDIGQQSNIAAENQETVKEMGARLQELLSTRRTR